MRKCDCSAGHCVQCWQRAQRHQQNNGVIALLIILCDAEACTEIVVCNAKALHSGLGAATLQLRIAIVPVQVADIGIVQQIVQWRLIIFGADVSTILKTHAIPMLEGLIAVGFVCDAAQSMIRPSGYYVIRFKRWRWREPRGVEDQPISFVEVAMGLGACDGAWCDVTTVWIDREVVTVLALRRRTREEIGRPIPHLIWELNPARASLKSKAWRGQRS
ncbi:hypothetical protein BDV98DRAFT_586679 [Pterulicium gracile]|uniref:Uncharacterized protein n=1 Tax=Pterulicium gracile TaxID=1884261 RepID=A0A5C3Q4Q0_9AGAR|nr:hypothetical protein BDV98DRAFT_586679 [Pterula gracilis]